MAMEKCMACGGMRDDSSGTCPGCIALGMKEAAAQTASSAPSWTPSPSRRRRPPRPQRTSYCPADRNEYITLLEAVCLAWEAAEFGADLNRQAKAAGANLDDGGRIEVTVFRDFACGTIRHNANDMLEHDLENGFGPSDGGSKWEDAYRRHSTMESRASKEMDGERLIWLIESIDKLSKVCDISETKRATYLARKAVKEWPNLIPWAFNMCKNCGHRQAVCECPKCKCCGSLGELKCQKCFCECGSMRSWRFCDGQRLRADERADQAGGVLLCPKCDCFECATRGKMAEAVKAAKAIHAASAKINAAVWMPPPDYDPVLADMVKRGVILTPGATEFTPESSEWPTRCVECDTDLADLECPTCRTPSTLSKMSDGTFTCGVCWLDTTVERARPNITSA